MDKVAQSSQGYSQPKRLVERYQGLIVAPPQRLAPVKAMASQFIIRDPNVGATVPRTSPGKGAQRTTLFLHVAKPWRLQAICGDQCWLGLALSYKECPSCAILGAGCQKASLGCEWLWEASPSCHVPLSRVGWSTLVYILQGATVTQGRRTPYLFALWQHLWKQWCCWGGNSAWKENGWGNKATFTQSVRLFSSSLAHPG